MDKQSFISIIKPILKEIGYRNSGSYWYKVIDSHICCVNVQGSQWDKDDYYLNVGFAFTTHKNPTILQWYCRHRCIGISGELNLLPEELLKNMEDIFGAVSKTTQIPNFLIDRNAVKVASQFWF